MKSNYILVTGGAGYIGSHTCLELYNNNYIPIVLDNLSQGNESFVKWGPFYKTDISETSTISSIIEKYNPIGCIHFAGSINVSESNLNPGKYFENNVSKTLRFLECLRLHSISNIIFSSTAAVYGLPKKTPIKETEEKKPINVYGHTKLIIEQALESLNQSHNMNSIALRYFNAAGSAYKEGIGEQHDPETHLIPNIISALKNYSEVSVFGNDYATPDKTCIRDYIHVKDIANAHLIALNSLINGTITFDHFNLGTGTGFSILDIINSLENITNQKLSLRLKSVVKVTLIS